MGAAAGWGEGEGAPPPFLPRSVGAEGGLGGKVRAALTPSPSPAARERGDLVRELGIVKDAGAPLLRSTPPFSPCMRAEGGWGEGEGARIIS